MGDARVPIAAVLDAFGVSATVTRPAPDDTPIPTTVAWRPPVTEGVPSGFEAQRRETYRVLVMPVADVPRVPNGTVIEAPEEDGGESKRWRVEQLDRLEPDSIHVQVIEIPDV